MIRSSEELDDDAVVDDGVGAAGAHLLVALRSCWLHRPSPSTLAERSSFSVVRGSALAQSALELGSGFAASGHAESGAEAVEKGAGAG
jgi:hypothetical protein